VEIETDESSGTQL